jgi:hypothetical protein
MARTSHGQEPERHPLLVMDETDRFAEGFKVVVETEIGEVKFDDGSDERAVEAAFKLIGRHNAQGVYRFPHEDGGDVVVEVSFEAVK